jgi:predicted deacylase
MQQNNSRPDGAIELTAPVISQYRHGNTGIDYVSRFDSGRPGPHVMVQALTHGNELCGAIALDFLLSQGLRPLAGTLTLAFANVAAFERWNPQDPDASRFVDEDLNRVWSDEALDSTRDSIELRRARDLRRTIDSVDYLLDIHSMSQACEPIMVCGTAGRGGEKSAMFARQLGVPRVLLIDKGHPAGLRVIERGGFGAPESPRTAILIECGQHWERSSVDVAIDTTLRFLMVTGTIDSVFATPRLRGQISSRQVTVRVTHTVIAKSPSFRFAKDFDGLHVISNAGEPIAYDDDATVTAPYDNTVLVMPARAHLKVGNTMVRLGHFES